MSLHKLDVSSWSDGLRADVSDEALDALESGQVLVLPLPFALLEREQPLLSPSMDGSRKNISFNPVSGKIKGAGDDAEQATALHGLLSRYHQQTRALAEKLFPDYREALLDGRTSYRPTEVAGRKVSSYRKDDTRLHVDAFPATPVQGRRMLRFFTNVNPNGQPRRWNVGEPFAAVAQRFMPRVPAYNAFAARLMATMKITKSLRSSYDHTMLHIHDGMKADLDYQASVNKTSAEFAPGTTWVVYSDQVSHAALGGRYMMEQTFYLPVSALRYPERSPLRVLERLVGHALV
jgi:hypothetical protein